MNFEPPKVPFTDYSQWLRWASSVGRRLNRFGEQGTATLSSGTAAITFAKGQPDASYQISLTGDASETFYYSSKAAAGFTINSSNGSSTADVDWMVSR